MMVSDSSLAITIIIVLAQAEVYIYFKPNPKSVGEADGRIRLCPSIGGWPNDVYLDEDLYCSLRTIPGTGMLCHLKEFYKHC